MLVIGEFNLRDPFMSERPADQKEEIETKIVEAVEPVDYAQLPVQPAPTSFGKSLSQFRPEVVDSRNGGKRLSFDAMLLLLTSLVVLCGALPVFQLSAASALTMNILIIGGTVFGPLLYLLPSLIAATRGSARGTAISCCNIFCGLLVVGWFIALWASLKSRVSEKISYWPFTFSFWWSFVLTGISAWYLIARNENSELVAGVGVFLAYLISYPVSLLLSAANFKLTEQLNDKRQEPSRKWEAGAATWLFTGVVPTGAVLGFCSLIIQLLFSYAQNLHAHNQASSLTMSLFAGVAALGLWGSVLIYAVLAAYFHYRQCSAIKGPENANKRWKVIPHLLPGLGFAIMPIWTSFCMGQPISVVVVAGLACMSYSVLMKRRYMAAFEELESKKIEDRA